MVVTQLPSPATKHSGTSTRPDRFRLSTLAPPIPATRLFRGSPGRNRTQLTGLIGRLPTWGRQEWQSIKLRSNQLSSQCRSSRLRVRSFLISFLVLGISQFPICPRSFQERRVKNPHKAFTIHYVDCIKHNLHLT